MKSLIFKIAGIVTVILVVAILYKKPAVLQYDRQKNMQLKTTVKIDTTLIDLGNVKVNRTMRGKYVIQNTGQEQLVVDNIVTNCTCTTAEYSGEPVKPGNFTTVVLKYDSTRVGPFQSTGILVSNSEPANTVLILRGNVVEK